jgi:hypothetical protein
MHSSHADPRPDRLQEKVLQAIALMHQPEKFLHIHMSRRHQKPGKRKAARAGLVR